MAFIKLDAAGVVIQKQPYPEDGFVEAPDDVIAGMVQQADGSFSAPGQPPVSIEQRRALAAASIDLHAKGLRDGVTALISAAEMSSWPIKREQALAYQASGNETDAPMLVAEAGWRQVTTAELAEMVLAKAATLSQLEAMISGECGRRQDILRTLDDIELIDAFAAGVAFDWPGFPDPEAPQ